MYIVLVVFELLYDWQIIYIGKQNKYKLSIKYIINICFWKLLIIIYIELLSCMWQKYHFTNISIIVINVLYYSYYCKY